MKFQINNSNHPIDHPVDHKRPDLRFLKKASVSLGSAKMVTAMALSSFSVLGFLPSLSHASPYVEEVPVEPSATPQVLIYDGVATAFGDTESLASILEQHGMTYQLATSDELNEMSVEQLGKFQLILWPGGYAGVMSASLDGAAREKIRKTVNEQGVSYLGICAGAFIAVSPSAASGSDGPDWGLSIIPSESLLPYYHLENKGIGEAMVDVQLSGGQTRSLVWWGGPDFPEVSQGVVARYSDNHHPAIIQTKAGKGFVILSGPHPEAPQSWRDKLGLQDSDGLDLDLAWKLIEAAMKRQPLPTV